MSDISNVSDMSENNNLEAVKRLSADLKINFENIGRINKAAAEEFEKMLAFAEESAKILLNQNTQNSKIGFDFLFDLINSEKSKVNFADIKKYILDENIFLCEHIFKSVNHACLFLAYLTYISAVTVSGEKNYKNIFELSGLADTGEINLILKLSEKFTLNDLMQYISLFGFDILIFYYDRIQNSVDISISVTNLKNSTVMLTVFIDLLKYYGISDVKLNCML